MCHRIADGRWVKEEVDIEDHGLRLKVYRKTSFREHCGLTMFVTEMFNVCRNSKCAYVEPVFRSQPLENHVTSK